MQLIRQIIAAIVIYVAGIIALFENDDDNWPNGAAA